MQILQRSLKSRFSFVSFRLWKSTMQHSTIDSDKPDRIDDHQNQNLAKLYTTKRQTHRVLSSNAFRYPCSSGVVALQGFPRKPIRHWASSSISMVACWAYNFLIQSQFFLLLSLSENCLHDMGWVKKVFFLRSYFSQTKNVVIARFSAGLIKLL